MQGIRFGVATDFSDEAEGVEPDVAQLFRSTLDLIRAAGGEIVDIELPNASHGLSAYYVIAPAEASANLARFDGVRYGLRVDGDDDLAPEMYERTRSQGFGPEVKRRIMLGTYALSSGYYDAYYGQAQRVRTKIAGDFRDAFEKCDFVVTPDLALRRVQARRAHPGPARDVPLGLLHRADVAGGHPRDLDPGRPGRRVGAAGRLPDRGARVL